MIIEIVTSIIPFVYESHPIDVSWKNPYSENTPQQVLVTFCGQNCAVISWVTMNVGKSSLTNSSSVYIQGRQYFSTPHYFIDSIECPTKSRLMHKVQIVIESTDPDVIPYEVFNLDTSRIFHLKKKSFIFDSTPLRVAMFGDLSSATYNHHTDTVIPLLRNLTKTNELDFVIHIGDIAYNLDDDCGNIGDAFMIDVESIGSRIPYIFGPGNHEQEKWELESYAHYNNRYHGQQILGKNSGSDSVRFYSVNQKMVHFSILDSDPFVEVFRTTRVLRMKQWLVKDLQQVNRAVTPWVVVLLHRAMYCTKSLDAECNSESEAIRNVIEEIILSNHVDVVMSGHTHHYERTHPVARGITSYSRYESVYTNPEATIHIQSGIAGGVGVDKFIVPQQKWESFRDRSYQRSLTVGTFFNSSHASFDQISSNGSIFDSFMIIKNKEIVN